MQYDGQPVPPTEYSHEYVEPELFVQTYLGGAPGEKLEQFAHVVVLVDEVLLVELVLLVLVVLLVDVLVLVGGGGSMSMIDPTPHDETQRGTRRHRR